MRRPQLLDLFCGAGGAATGYAIAGFDVIGVDIHPQPNYPFSFWQGDAMDFLVSGIHIEFAAIHASPPCQAYTAAAEIHDTAGNHPDLIAPVRKLLVETGLPWVMENVERSPLNASLMLCGSMFGLGVKRHRLFESNVLMLGPPCGSHRKWYASVFGGRCVGRQRVTRAGPGKRKQTWDKFEDELGTARRAMGINWMDLGELSEAIPPAYTEWIGRHLLATLVRRVA
jgi:DNA (cytosine-5)-methyltransferase 1